MNLTELIHTRRSIRHYTDQSVPLELINQLLEAASWAPSAHNRQPWRFVVISTPEAKHHLAAVMGERLRADRLRDGDPLEAIERDVARSHDRIVQAPIVIIACLSMNDMDRYPNDRRTQAERTMAIQGVAMSMQNMLLTAHDLGLGACWMCAPLFCSGEVRSALALPIDWEAQALITIGYPIDQSKSKDRVNFKQKTIYR
ncbi:MAG TPA: nitroreductase family protein [Anaerolineae bacterium]|nr:nitroreductase family protein [Anaerolineae bacterium]